MKLFFVNLIQDPLFGEKIGMFMFSGGYNSNCQM